MSEANQEPTMEEILASIRRIISEDEAPAEGGEPAAEAAPAEEEPVAEGAAFEPPPPPPPPADEPAAFAEEAEELDDGVLELTERVELDEPAETHGDIEVYAPSDPEPEPVRAAPREPYNPPADEEPLIGRSAAQTAASAFGQLAQSLAMPRDGRTLEDVVRELLKPLLKQWLDEHLPEIVQAKVEAEVERIARGPRR